MILIFVINRQVFGWTLQMTMPVPFASAALVLLVLATVLASLQPARRAARVHLTEAVHMNRRKSTPREVFLLGLLDSLGAQGHELAFLDCGPRCRSLQIG